MIARTDGLRLACRFREGEGPVVVFLPGYMSDMEGSKALALDAWAATQGRAMLRLDYGGCGASEGRFEDGTLASWRDDARCLIDRLAADRSLLLVGSSMGGWIALLLGEALGSRVAGLVGIAAAPDFTRWGFTDAQKAVIREGGRLVEPSDYGDAPHVTTRAFWESGEVNLMLDRSIAIDAPVRLLHGQSDPDVPWHTALRIAEQVRSGDVRVTLIKDGDHRLSRSQDIGLLVETVASLI